MLIGISDGGPRRQGLVDLLAECHGRIRRFVALAADAARRTDAPEAQVRAACADVTRYFTEALPLHVADEEESLLPRLRGRAPEVDQALARMAEQHAAHGPALARFLGAVADVARDPADAAARERLAPLAGALADSFEAHLSLEETTIFPAIDAHLTAAERAEIVAELRQRRAPSTGAPRSPGT